MLAIRRLGRSILALLILSVAHLATHAQNSNYPGYLGVYVQEDVSGMEITGFIPRTPAASLADQGQINTGDVIVRLAGMRTRTLQELTEARSRIRPGMEGRMVLRDGGGFYHVWIGRSPSVGRSNAGQAYSFRPGGRGEGNDLPDIRPIHGASGRQLESESNPDIRVKP